MRWCVFAGARENGVGPCVPDEKGAGRSGGGFDEVVLRMSGRLVLVCRSKEPW